jgi:predicted transcriptional regulator
LDKSTGILSGDPTNSDVGIYYVNITVLDPANGKDSHNFTIEVLNVNDPPIWLSVPADKEIDEGDQFIFSVNATDIDTGDVLSYSISSKPDTNIIIDPETGLLNWTPRLQDPVTAPVVFEFIVSATDGEEIIVADFNITVAPNFRPTVSLVSPADYGFVSVMGTELKWEGTDNEDEQLTFDLYFSRDISLVTKLLESARVLFGSTNTSYFVAELDVGSIYYWTVIPFDGFSRGTCPDGIFSFRINSPPFISEIPAQKVTVGKEFKIKVEATDENIADSENFVFSLESGPADMFISSNNGLIVWVPTKDQVGSYIVNVQVSDGLDFTNTTFQINVTKIFEESLSFQWSYIIITTSIILLIIITNIALASTEVGKYKFYSLIFIPLYNRLHPDNIFNNFLRGQIYGYIKAKPGDHYNSIKSSLELNNGTLAHHAKVLEKGGYIYSKRDKFYTRFYPQKIDKSALAQPKLNQIQEELIKIIQAEPGITQHELIEKLDISQQVASYNLTKLSRENVIWLHHEHGENRYYFNYPELSRLETQAPDDYTENDLEDQHYLEEKYELEKK